jgi:hypothetical protein
MTKNRKRFRESISPRKVEWVNVNVTELDLLQPAFDRHGIDTFKFSGDTSLRLEICTPMLEISGRVHIENKYILQTPLVPSK